MTSPDTGSNSPIQNGITADTVLPAHPIVAAEVQTLRAIAAQPAWYPDQAQLIRVEQAVASVRNVAMHFLAPSVGAVELPDDVAERCASLSTTTLLDHALLVFARGMAEGKAADLQAAGAYRAEIVRRFDRHEGANVTDLIATMRSTRSVLATALRLHAPDLYATDEDIDQHIQIKRIDAALVSVKDADLVPRRWKIDRTERGIRIVAPHDGPGFLHMEHAGSSLESRLLHALALALITGRADGREPNSEPNRLTEHPKQYSWSHDEEHFNGRLDSREAAIADAINNGGDFQPGAIIWIGEAVEVDPALLVNADHIIDNIRVAAGDVAGEAGEDYLSIVSTEQFDELGQLVCAWMQRVEPVYFWSIRNSERYVITAENLAND